MARLLQRISEMSRFGFLHQEVVQVLRYEPGQQYMRHHDYDPTRGRDGNGPPVPAGPRVLTVFMYLSDVDEGGETEFTDLRPPIAVAPKPGRVLIWPSVMDEDHLKQDARTHHRAKPVLSGVKLAANVWLHLHEFRKPNLWGCTGAFA